jgi:hypothetical protein
VDVTHRIEQDIATVGSIRRFLSDSGARYQIVDWLFVVAVLFLGFAIQRNLYQPANGFWSARAVGLNLSPFVDCGGLLWQ